MTTWAKAHPEAIRIINRRYNQKNRAKRLAYKEKYRLAHPDKDRLWKRRTAVLSKYGISLEQKQELIKAQNNRCLICRLEFVDEPYSPLSPCVDHCHTSKTIRGILCHNCNRAIGLMKDDTNRLLRAVDYLIKGERL